MFKFDWLSYSQDMVLSFNFSQKSNLPTKILLSVKGLYFKKINLSISATCRVYFKVYI